MTLDASSSLTPVPSSTPYTNQTTQALNLRLNALRRQLPLDTQQPRYIAVAGNIGVGKSSLVEFLCTRYNFKPYFEPNEDNPYLEDFYGDMNRYAFHSQVYFLSAKAGLHHRLESSRRHVIQDRTIWEDAEIFARNLHQLGIMSERDYTTYRSLYASICSSLRPPDLMIYLHSDLRTVRQRIAKRGRAMEQDIPLEYLQRLQKLYDEWIESYDLSPLIKFRSDRLDYITDLVDCHEVMSTIEEYL